MAITNFGFGVPPVPERPVSGGLGSDGWSQILMGLALMDAGRPQVNPPPLMQTLSPMLQMQAQQSALAQKERQQKQLMDYASQVLRSAPEMPGLADDDGAPGGLFAPTSGGAPAYPSTGSPQFSAGGATPSAVERFLDLARHHESGGRNVMQGVAPPGGGFNPSVGRVTGPSTAQGYYQITNTTWRNFAPQAGVDLAVYPTAMSAPPEVQRHVARTIATTDGVQHWTDFNPRLRLAVEAAGLPVSGPIGAGAPPVRLAQAGPQTMTDAPPAGDPRSGMLSQYTPEEMAALRARGMIGPHGIPTVPPGAFRINSRGEPYAADLAAQSEQERRNVAASMAAIRAGAQGTGPRGSFGDPSTPPAASGVASDTVMSPQRVAQASAIMPQTPPPANPETVRGATTQRAAAVRSYHYWSRAMIAAGMLGEGGKGIIDAAKANLDIAKEFLTAEQKKRLDLIYGPQIAAAEEAARTGPLVARAWQMPDASPELQGRITGAREAAQQPYLLERQQQQADLSLRNQQQAPTGDMRDYQAYVADQRGRGQEPLSFFEWSQATRRSGQPLNLGSIPQDYQVVPVPGGGYRMELVPGSPTARAAGQARDQSRIAANVVIGNIDNAKNLSSYWTTGLLGSYTSRIPGTPGHDLAATIETLGSNAAFERLQAMRESSPTGGALGQVSNYENQMLRSAYWSLAQSQSKEQFERNLDNFKKTFLDVVYGTDERLKDRLDAGEITKKQYDDTISLKRGAAARSVPGTAQPSGQPAAPRRYIWTPNGLVPE